MFFTAAARLRLVALLLCCGFQCFGAIGESSAADLNGRWTGTWLDTKSGHHGPLRGTFRQCENGDSRVAFSGRFFRVIPFRYNVTLNVVGEADGKLLLAGESRLPLFGVFTCSAEATDCDFVCHCSSRRYQGRFDLHRSE
jgi:hypothetical protein